MKRYTNEWYLEQCWFQSRLVKSDAGACYNRECVVKQYLMLAFWENIFWVLGWIALFIELIMCSPLRYKCEILVVVDVMQGPVLWLPWFSISTADHISWTEHLAVSMWGCWSKSWTNVRIIPSVQHFVTYKPISTSRTVQILWGRRKFSINIPTRATSTDLCQALQRQTPRDMTEFMLKPQGGRGYVSLWVFNLWLQ